MKSFKLPIILLSFFLLIACTTNTPENTVDNFMTAFKKNDINELLDTIEPQIAQQAKGILVLAGSVVDIDAEDLLDTISSVNLIVGKDRDFEYKIINVEKNDEKAIVKVSINEDKKIVMFSLVKIDGTWYIDGYDD